MTRCIMTALVASLCLACGGGVPIQVLIDEFTMEIELDETVDAAFQEFLAQGLLPSETGGIPEIWPDSLPDIRYSAVVAADPVPVDLTPDPEEPADPEAPAEEGQQEAGGKYSDINTAGDVISRIEINKFVLRVEESSLTLGLPELRLQVADAQDARGDDRLAWWTIGSLPATEQAGFVGDIPFEFNPGGETFLNSQLGDEAKEFAMRVQGKIDIDTEKNPRRPGGRAVVRMIIVATFFVKPEGAL